MERFTRLRGIAAPLLRDNIDTDAIIRVERLFNAVPRSDLGLYCLESLRKRADGTDDPSFPFNDPRYDGASILLTGHNFGCGSAREGAVWALASKGIRCVIAPSLAELFVSNCFQNGVLALTLDEDAISAMAQAVEQDPRNRPIEVDLEKNRVSVPGGGSIAFAIHPLRREAMLEGLDEISLTLKRDSDISAFREADRKSRPWIYRIHG